MRPVKERTLNDVDGYEVRKGCGLGVVLFEWGVVMSGFGRAREMGGEERRRWIKCIGG